MGTDIPDLSAAVMAAALEELDAHEVVLGPACDGGFYLVGATRVPAAFMKVSAPSVPDFNDDDTANCNPMRSPFRLTRGLP